MKGNAMDVKYREIVESRESPDLVVSPDSHCSLTAADVTKFSLFSNLLVDTKPIAARFRRFSQEDKKFI